jgi:gliding motility-associated-like protein
VFNYAVVLQNADHEEHEQPRFTVNVFNDTKAAYIECSSFDFVIGFNDPDFQASQVDAQVFYKPWSSAAINLNAFKGDNLRLEFTVTDCAKGGHFGYAYFDVMEKCSNSVTGNIVCPGVGNVSLHAPDHFAGYQWFTGNFSQPLGIGKSYTVSAPAVDDSFAVVLIPFSYLGCRDTFYTKITSVSDLVHLVVKDSVNGCSDGGADLTRPEIIQGSSTRLKLEYYSDASATQPVPNPREIKTPGVYYIRASNEAGCVQTKPVVLNILATPAFEVTEPAAVVYPQTVNLTTVMDNSQLVYTFWEDQALTKRVHTPTGINESGTYYIKGTNAGGCFSVRAVEVKVAPALFVPNAFTPNGDGKNDWFVYTALGRFKKISFFKIFNRWGQEIFNTGTTGASWDGTYRGKPVESGTYVWMLRATDWLNKVHTAKGTVLLIR